MSEIEKYKPSILGKKEEMEEHENYKLAKSIKTPKKEKIKVDVPEKGVSKELVLSRAGTDEKAIAKILTDKKASQEQKDAIIASYLFERGKENASFLAELYISKGKLTTETRKFKSDIRFDFSAFVDAFQHFLIDTADGIRNDVDDMLAYEEILKNIADRFESASEMLGDKIAKITKQRMEEAGYGVYLGKDGKPFKQDD